MWPSQPTSLHTAKVSTIIIAKQPVLVQLKGYRSYNNKFIAGLFLQTVNIIIIAKQPVLIQLKVFVIISRPEGDRTRPFLSSTFDLFGSIS